MGFYSIKDGHIVLNIKVATGMQRTKIAWIRNDELVVHINARPERDLANKELVRFLAKTFDITRSDIEIRSGHHSHHKVIILPGSTAGLLEVLAKEKL